MALQFTRVDRAGSAVLRAVLREDAFLGQSRQQVHGDDGLAGARAALRDEHALLAVLLALAR